jgi:hypothetical protein
MPIPNKEGLFSQPPSAGMDHHAVVLSSWKDIAKFIGKGVRTAQRWEKELGLPVRRPKQGGKSAVLAIPLEINRWIGLQGISEGRRQEGKSERDQLLRRILELQEENLKLKQQVQMLCAKSA